MTALFLSCALLCTIGFVNGLKILVLGGTGFVGSNFIKLASEKGHEIVSVSRRTSTSGSLMRSNIKYVKGDATNAKELEKIINSEKVPFDACIHCIGLLFDSESGLLTYNKVMSGSGSVPSSDATYEKITAQTASNAMDILMKKKKIPFVFVSAAEAGWDFKAPVDFLEKYLVAKRKVESSLLASKKLRGVVLRPSLIWQSSKPTSFLAVLPFFVGSAIGLPFVDKPIQVEVLVAAALKAMLDPAVGGIKTYREMEPLARSL